jgi:hypothetical protein
VPQRDHYCGGVARLRRLPDLPPALGWSPSDNNAGVGNIAALRVPSAAGSVVSLGCAADPPAVTFAAAITVVRA